MRDRTASSPSMRSAWPGRAFRAVGASLESTRSTLSSPRCMVKTRETLAPNGVMHSAWWAGVEAKNPSDQVAHSAWWAGVAAKSPRGRVVAAMRPKDIAAKRPSWRKAGTTAAPLELRSTSAATPPPMQTVPGRRSRSQQLAPAQPWTWTSKLQRSGNLGGPTLQRSCKSRRAQVLRSFAEAPEHPSANSLAARVWTSSTP
mmetsp:Transcript_77042/g.178694  ORF Transcript_77042/g.178694 Transcript_77042/m.178694 type:complete len:201 (+) Transcript_77042:630-1232(+)